MKVVISLQEGGLCPPLHVGMSQNIIVRTGERYQRAAPIDPLKHVGWEHDWLCRLILKQKRRTFELQRVTQ